MKKILFIPVIALLLFGVATAFVSADSTHPLAQRFMERFNLSEDEVNEVMEEHRAEKHTQMQERYEERLDQAVLDGKITEEQKQLIIENHNEFRGEMMSLTWEEKKEKRGEMKEWMQENGIDCPGKTFNGSMGRKGGRGMYR